MKDRDSFPPIVLYTQPDCQRCWLVKYWLRVADVPYKVVDISEDQDAKKFVVNDLRATTTPIVTHVLWDYPIIGYHEDETKELIATVKAYMEYRSTVGLDIEKLHDYVYEEEDEND